MSGGVIWTIPGAPLQAVIPLLLSLLEAIALLLLLLLLLLLAVGAAMIAILLLLLLQAAILHLLLQAVIPRPLQNQMRTSQVAPLPVERNLPSISQKLTEAIDP